MVLTSTRTIPGGRLDAFSDYDVIVAVSDFEQLNRDRSWLEDYGPTLVTYHDPLKQEHGFQSFACITQYENGEKIDYSICETGRLKAEVAQARAAGRLEPDLDLGYRVLLDKDGLTEGMPAPTHRAFIPSPPSEAEYRRVVEEFFHEATYLVKDLWRGDLLPAKFILDQMMKQNNLLPMLEWHYEIDKDWSVKTGALGKGLQRSLRPDLYAELQATYVGPGEAENAEAMWRTVALFRKAAQEVGAVLGYAYPAELDGRVTRYLKRVLDLPRDVEAFRF